MKKYYYLFIILSILLVSQLSAQEAKYKILLSSEIFLPEKNLTEWMRERPSQTVDGKYFQLVQFYDVPTAELRREMAKAGMILGDYIPNYLYEVTIDEKFHRPLAQHFGIRAIFPFDQRFTFSQEVAKGDFPAHAVSGNQVRLLLRYQDDLGIEQVSQSLNGLGIILDHKAAYKQATVLIAKQGVPQLAQNPTIKRVEVVPPAPILENTIKNTSGRSNWINTGVNGLEYNGEGVTLSVQEGGLFDPAYEPELKGRHFPNNSAASVASHKTQVASSHMASAGNLDPRNRSVAIGADVITQTSHANYQSNFANSSVSLASVNHSYGFGIGTSGWGTGVTWDAWVRDSTGPMHTWSAGNQYSNPSTYGPYSGLSGYANLTGGIKMAKNTMTVGALNNDDELGGFSSKGPAYDGRLKPELTIEGSGGTSYAAPKTSGVFGILVDAFRGENAGSHPHPSLLKAIMMNTCDDLENAGPDYRTGYGQINARRAYQTIVDDRHLKGVMTNGGSNNHMINVPANVSQVRILVHWPDYPAASSLPAKALVNDLDMTVTDPGSTVYLPWVLDPTANLVNLAALAQRKTDTLNNTEQVTIDNPAAGSYTINIAGTMVPQGPQDYYLTYEFLYDELTLTYPIGCEHFVPGETERIKWDSYGGTGTFTLEYSTNNGGSWTSIATGLANADRNYQWTVPTLTSGQVLVRISRDALSSQSQKALNIMALPTGLQVLWACADQVMLTWDPMAGASQYRVMRLGAKYMDSVDVTSNTYYLLTGMSTTDSEFFSLQAYGADDALSRRVIAIEKPVGDINCSGLDMGVIAANFNGTYLPDCMAGGSIPLKAVVQNLGTVNASSITVKYQLNGGTIYSENIAGPLSPPVQDTVTFSQLPAFASGTNTILIWTETAGDVNINNDTLYASVEVYSSATVALPYTQNFDNWTSCSSGWGCANISCTVEENWFNIPNTPATLGDSIDWRTNANGTGSSNTGPSSDHTSGSGKYLYLEGTNSSGGPCTNKLALLNSPCFDLTSYTSAQVSFWYHMYGITMGEMHVDVLTENGKVSDVMTPITGDQGNMWIQATVDLSAYVGQVIVLQFRGVTGNGFRTDLAIDDISVMGVQAAPVPVCQALTIDLDATGNASLAASAVDDGSTGDGPLSFALAPSTFDCAFTGNNAVTLTVTDVNSNTSSCTATIFVQDVIAPSLFNLACGSSNASGTDYNDGWQSGDNDGSGFGAWALSATTGNTAQAGHFVGEAGSSSSSKFNGGASDSNGDDDIDSGGKALALYANNSQTSDATRPITGTFAEGSTLSAEFDNGFLDAGASVGFQLQNSSGQSLGEVRFQGGDSNYELLDANGVSAFTSLGFTDEGISIVVTNLGNAQVSYTVTRLVDNVSQTLTSDLIAQADQQIAQFRVFNFNAGTGGQKNVYVNNMEVCIASPACPADIAVANDPGQCDAVVNYDTPVASDNCDSNPAVNQTAGSASGVAFPIGMTTNTFTTTDAAGNTTSCSFTVTVNGPDEPVALCKNITVQLDANGMVDFMASDIDNGSTDNCGGSLSFAVSSNTFDCTSLPTIEPGVIISEYVEGSGNNKYIEIFNGTGASVDMDDYRLKLYSNGNSSPNTSISLGAYTLASGEVVVYQNSAANIYNGPTINASPVNFNGDDAIALVLEANDSIVDVFGVIGEDPGSQWSVNGNTTQNNTLRRLPAVFIGRSSNATSFPALGTEWEEFNQNDISGLGSHDMGNVTLTVTDVSGNTASCLAVVSVEDQLAPTAICQDLTVQLDLTGSVNISATDVNNNSSDNCGITTWAVSPNTFDCTHTTAQQQVVLTVGDASNNSDQCTAMITVQDVTPPTATCQDATVQLDATGNASIATSDINDDSSDNCGIISWSVSPNTFDCDHISSPQQVTLMVSDASGNANQCTALVTVEDVASPTALCQGITIQLDPGGNASIIANDIDGGSTDNCGFTLAASPTTYDCTTTGAQTTTLTVTDDAGNMASCTAHVTVEDNLAPTAICQDATVSFDISGMASVAISDVDNNSTDNCGIISRSISPNTFDCSSPDLSTVTLTAGDASGNNSQCTATVTITDPLLVCCEDPVAICKNATVFLDANGIYTLASSEVDNGSSADCNIQSRTVSPNTFDCSSIASNDQTVTLTITDNGGNQATCTAAVTVLDQISPNALCKDISVDLDNGGNASIAATEVDNGSSDACGIASFVVVPNTFNCNQVGSNTVTLTATDNNSNQSNCTADVTVNDNLPPTAVCQDITIDLDASGNASIVGTDIDNGSSDACNIASLAASPNTFTCSNLGANTVSLTVTDVAGNLSSCTADVRVENNNPPTAVCQDIQVFLNGAGNASITAADIDGGSNGVCGNVSLAANPTSFVCSEVGSNTVTLTVTDAQSNTGSCAANVTVTDSTKPAALCGSLTIFLDGTGNASITTGDVDNGSNDNCSVASLGLSQSNFNCTHVSSNPNQVTLTVVDNSSNVATCTSNITVQDSVKPTAVCQDITIGLDATGNASIMGSDIDNGSTDACGLASLAVSPSTFTCSDLGPNSVSLIATDNSGNMKSCAAIVTIVNDNPPTARCQDLSIFLNGSGNGTITTGDLDNGSGGVCGNVTLAADITSFTCSDIGANTVTLTATDAQGNTASCTSNVTVADSTKPSAVCQTLTIQLDANGMASIVASEVDNGSMDNCGISSLAVTPNTFGCDEVATSPNAVTLTVTDNSGNQKTCMTTVTVEDDIAPNAICQDITIGLDASGNASIAGTDVDNGSSDGCGIASLSVSPNTFDCDDIASSNAVTLLVTDNNSNQSTCTAAVTVQDNISPTALCQDLTVNLDMTGNASILATDVDNGSSDACGLASTSVSPTTFNCDNLRQSNIVTLSLSDIHGNQSSCTAQITVEDPLSACCAAPIASCQDVTVSLDANGAYSLAVSEVDNGSTAECGLQSIIVSPNSFDCTATAMDQMVTLSITDINSDAAQCTASVTVKDNTDPTALCQDITISLDANGNASITANDVDNGSSDACGIASLAVAPNTFDCDDVGPNTVTLTVTDNNANQSTCTADVMVEDNTDPTALCQDITISLDANGNASITANDVDNGSSDACGIASLAVSPNTFDCDDVGPNTVTLTVTDNNANQSTCTADVMVEDNTDPTALCQDITISLDANGNASITANDVDNGSSDACGIASLAVAPNTFDCDDVGPNTVTLTVTDNNANQSTCTADVTVEDNTDPTALCQDITISLDANGNASITANDVDNGSSDACGIASLAVAPNTFDCDDVGPNTVTLTVTDNNANQSTCTADVTVEDNTDPTALCQDITISLDANGNASITANDVDNGSSDACGIASLAVSPNTFDCDDVGPNTVTLTVTDNNANQSTCTADVTVEDNTDPTALCQDITISLDANGNASITANDVDNGSSDACGIASLAVAPNTFDCDDVGPNTVTLTVTDNNANQSTCTADVMVEDNTDPTALCQDITISLDANGNASITATDVDNGSSDACGIASLAVAPNTFNCDDVGPNTVTLTVTDNNANQSTCTADVTVEDNTDPTAICQPTTVVLSALDGTGSITAADIDGGSSDACGISSLSASPNTFDCSMVGNNTATLTVTDNNGNTASCTANVFVDDSQSKPATLAPQSCGSCNQIRIFYCQFDPNPASLNDFIDGTVAMNANFVAGNTLFWYEDNAGSVGAPVMGTGQEPATPDMNIAFATYLYWVAQIDQNTGCFGDPIQVRVRVRKTPTPVFNAPATPFCEGAQLNLAALVDDPNNVADVFDFYDGDPTSGGTLIGSATATNGSVDAGQVVVATPVVGSNTFYVVATNQGNANSITCPATTSMTFTVSAKPVLTPNMDVIACPGDPVNVNFSSTPSAGAIFVWINSNTNIGLGATGFGNLNFAAANTSGSAEVSQITVRAIVNGCPSEVDTFTVTVNPVAIIDPASDVTACSNTPTGLSLSTLIGSPAAASYELVSVSLDPGLVANPGNQAPASGLAANALANDQYSNTTAASLNATYFLVSSTANGCASDTQTVTATIVPQPVISAGLADTVCSGQAANLALTLSNGLTGANFAWTPQSLPAGISLVTNTSPGTVIADVLTNSTNAPIDVTYDVAAFVGTCLSSSQTVTIRVVPFPAVPPTASLDACEDLSTPGQASFDLTSLTTTIGGGLIVNYFSDPNLLNPIANPTAFVSGSTIVYASVVNPGAACPNRTDITLTVNSVAPPVIGNILAACGNTSQVLAPAPVVGISFNFYDADPAAGGMLLSSGASYDPMLASGSSAVIWVTATDGTCESDAVAVTVTVNPVPTAMASAALNNGALCEGDTLLLFGNGGGSYSWTGPNGFSSTTQNNTIAGVSQADSGNYILTVTDGNGCSDMDTVHVHIDTVANPGGNGTLTIAANAQPVNLFDQLTGTPSRGGIWAGPSAAYGGDQGIFNPNFMLSGVYTYTLPNPAGCQDSFSTATVTVNVTPVANAVKVSARVFLEGLVDTTTLPFLMFDSLRATKFMPTAEPYTLLGYQHVNGGGNETFPVEQLDSTGNDALVDWVVVELRSSADPTLIVATRSALLQRDGDIVDLDGVSPVCFNRVTTGFYHVVVLHRNHLSVMTAAPVFLNTTALFPIDFTGGVLSVFGTNPQNIIGTSILSSGARVMVGGDADFNGQVQNSDDVNFWNFQVGGSGYLEADYNCDGQVQNNDRVFIWSPNVGKGTQVPPRSN